MGAALSPGVVVGGDFRILEPLMAGGMGAVYVAEQLSTGKRRALKVMHATLVDDPAQVERFVREARLAARVQSEHVVEILAAGVQADGGTPWLAMELLEGCDLSRLIKLQGPLELEDALAISEQLCHGLAAAHDEGIVHRDLKPQNVFFAKRRTSDRPWTVKILDFGIAKAVADATTAATAALGSPAWMAPEQTEASGTIAPSSDVWSLGLVVFWMITGRVYWKAANLDKVRMKAVFREMLFEPIGRGSERARAIEAPSDFPVRLDDWLACCLQREPGDRFANAREGWKALSKAAGYGAPSSHVLPATVASRVAEAAGATTRRDATAPSTELEGAPETAATRDVTPEDDGAPETAATRDVTPRPDVAPTLDVTPPSSDAPGGAREQASQDPGPTLESHELVSRRQQAEREVREATGAPTARRIYLAALIVGGGLAVAAFAMRDGPPTPPATTADTTSMAETGSTTSHPPSSATVVPTASADGPLEGSLAAARRALEEDRLDDAERAASEVLTRLGDVAGRRPASGDPSLVGAAAQRVLVGVALARARRQAPLTPDGGVTLDALASAEPFVAEAMSACSKAQSWADDGATTCCHADLAAHLLDEAAAIDAANLRDGEREVGAINARARRSLEAVTGEPTACAELVSRSRQRLRDFRDGRAGNVSSTESLSPGTVSSKPALRPFDEARASRRIEFAISVARRTCSRLVGSRTVTVTLTYDPSGWVSAKADGTTPTGVCVANQMHLARIEPFDPKTTPGPRTVVVTLE
jgi:tRNA A-37 threonylcarbamoyl transferase component Bud32